jgi:hypothetical protein
VPDADDVSDDVERVRRWEDSGAIWRVLHLRADGVSMVFCRCDGSEIVDRWFSTDPRLRIYLDGRTSNDPG